MLAELIEQIFEENPEIETMANGHNYGFSDNFNQLPQEIVERVQSAIRDEYGDTIELYHGTPNKISTDIVWNENTSFTDNESEAILFSEEHDGYIVVAQVPVERIKFYLDWEDEFIITAGQLDCEVCAIKEYFGFDESDEYE